MCPGKEGVLSSELSRSRNSKHFSLPYFNYTITQGCGVTVGL